MRAFLISIIFLGVIWMPRPSRGDEAGAGRALLDRLNCTACHTASEAQTKWLAPKAAPRLDEIGNRASAEWIEAYLAAPNDVMPGTTMPDLLGTLPADDRAASAEALTHFLLSQKPGSFTRVLPDRAAVARGEKLYQHVGCVACHAPNPRERRVEGGVTALPDMSRKWSLDGLRRFLLDPLTTRPSGRMPAMRLTDREASDIANYLLRDTRVRAAVELAVYQGELHSLDDLDGNELRRTRAVDEIAVNQNLPERNEHLRFTAYLRVDMAAEYTFYLKADGAARLAIDGDWLMGQGSWDLEQADEHKKIHLDNGEHEIKVDFVGRGRQPTLSLQWEGPRFDGKPTQIPSSRLSVEPDPVHATAAFIVDPAKAAQGRALYERFSCGVCHEAKAPAHPLAALSALKESRGCLAEDVPAKAPNFHLDAARRADLTHAVEFLNQPTLAAPTPAESLAGVFATFNCSACHARDGKGGVTAARDALFVSNVSDTGDEGRLPPKLDGVGDKLQPAWIDKVLTDGASVRPALEARMPRFGRDNVGRVGALFIAIDRKTTNVAKTADDSAAQKEAGRKIVGTTGLSCIVCHRFNRQAAQTMQMVDLTTTPDRLNEDWFNRFLRDPNRFHPNTRMPAFWPEGKSLLPAVMNGDTGRQLAAIWSYLSDGPRAKFPEGLSRQGVELVVGGEAIVYRGKLWEAGYRAVAIGFPGQFNAAFDAEELRLSLLWRGRFLNAGAHWEIQGMGQIRPLGNDVVVFPHGPPMAILARVDAPWPTQDSKLLGMKWRGYQLDSIRRPTLLYSFGKLNVEDFLTPIDNAGKPTIRRTIGFMDAVPANLYFRVAAGKITAHGENAWRFNNAITLSIHGGAKPLLRGKGDLQELLVPVQFSGKDQKVEVDYAW